MPVSVGVSLAIILTVAVTTFATRALPFLVFPKGKAIPKTIEYLGKCADPGGDRNVGRVLSERYAGDDGAAWAAGVDRSRNGSGTAFVETEQSAEHRRRDDFIYGSCADGILICPDHKNKKRETKKLP